MAQAQNRRSEGAASSPVEDAGIGIAVGLFPDLHTAKDAVKALKAAGFTDKDIGLTMRDPSQTEGQPRS